MTDFHFFVTFYAKKTGKSTFRERIMREKRITITSLGVHGPRTTGHVVRGSWNVDRF